MENSGVCCLYKLAKGESLQAVSQKFNMPISVLKNTNSSLKIHGGVTIVVPICNSKTHTVKPCDSIQSICDAYQISAEEFKSKNNINFLYTGMIVEI